MPAHVCPRCEGRKITARPTPQRCPECDGRGTLNASQLRAYEAARKVTGTPPTSPRPITLRDLLGAFGE